MELKIQGWQWCDMEELAELVVKHVTENPLTALRIGLVMLPLELHETYDEMIAGNAVEVSCDDEFFDWYAEEFYLDLHKVGGGGGKRYLCRMAEEVRAAIKANPDRYERLLELRDDLALYINLPSEVKCLKTWKRKLEEKQQARVFIDVKENEVVVHSCEHPEVAGARFGSLIGWPMMRMGGSRVSEFLVHYQSNLKFVLDDPESREFTVYRMCYRGEGGWMYLESGALDILAKKTMPHLELESFYELM